MHNGTGRLITFEGGDGSGKSTQLHMTAAWLQGLGHEAIVTHEPGDTPVGSEIRRLLLEGEYTPVPGCELFLFLADRAQHVSEVIMPALDRGAWVLCDRFSDSTMAYQLAGRSLADSDGLAAMLKFAESGATPDLTLWFDLPVTEALHRIRSRSSMGEESTRLDEEAQSFHELVHAAFAQLHRAHGERIARIDASEAIEQVQKQVQAAFDVRGMV
ncbi:MAG: dTMP kinase [Mariprofundaceae bacterium]|nr:dTMP kinase [Mariprofundaceae bacterium]